jgi:hypothetical protein
MVGSDPRVLFLPLTHGHVRGSALSCPDLWYMSDRGPWPAAAWQLFPPVLLRMLGAVQECYRLRQEVRIAEEASRVGSHFACLLAVNRLSMHDLMWWPRAFLAAPDWSRPLWPVQPKDSVPLTGLDSLTTAGLTIENGLCRWRTIRGRGWRPWGWPRRHKIPWTTSWRR